MTTSSRRNPKAWKLEQIETITPAESPAPHRTKESPVEMQVETEDLKESQSLMTNRSTIFGQRNVKDFMDMDNITGNILDTNDF